MSDQDKEAFDKWYLKTYRYDYHDLVIPESVNPQKEAWQSACEYKQKEINRLKESLDHYVSEASVYYQSSKKLQAENKQLLTENGILSGEILTYKKMSDDALKKLAEAERFITDLNNNFDDTAEEEAAEFNELMKDCEELKIENKRLKREVEVLRYYGNKDCTNMADEALEKE